MALPAGRRLLRRRATPPAGGEHDGGGHQAALAGLGIIRVLSYQVADELRTGSLQELLTEFAPDPFPSTSSTRRPACCR